MQFEFTYTQKKIISLIQREGGDIYIVGGAIRDHLMNRESNDIDFTTSILPNITKDILQKEFTIIPDYTAFSHGTLRILDKDTGQLIDLSTLKKNISNNRGHSKVEFTDSIYYDLARRDLTINAMAIKINRNGHSDTFIDPYQGKHAIYNKYLHFVDSSPYLRIKEDYLRLLRACRFTALGNDWHISEADMLIMRNYAHEITSISKERIRDEILKALGYNKPSNFFRALASTNLLNFIFPDLAKGIDCKQNDFHSESVFDHLLRACDFSVNITDNILLRLAVLTHDIGKPHTKSLDNNNLIHFYKHDIVGSLIISSWMKKYKFKKADIQYVSKLVKFHQWRFEKSTKTRTIRKWLQDVGIENWRDLMILRCADRRGNLKNKDKPMITHHMKEFIDCVEKIISSGEPISKEDLVINGNDLKNIGISPGKKYKEIFRELLGLVINNPSKNNKKELTNFVIKHYTNSHGKQ